MKLSEEFRHTLFTLTASIVSGALAGAIAGWMFVQAPALPYEFPAAEGASNATTTPAQPDITVIPVDRTAEGPIVPPAFANRRNSSIAAIYARSAKSSADLLTDDDLLTEAVAITSDGWFVAPQSAVGDRRLSDLLFWYGGRVATATKAVLDERADVVYFKTPVQNLPSPAFARYQDVSPGLAGWLEHQSGSFEPVSVVALNRDIRQLNGDPSSRSTRRLLLSGTGMRGNRGAPVWGTNGTLVGIVDSEPGEPLALIPASAWSPSLSSVLLGQDVHHAELGIRSLDLVYLRLLHPSPDTAPRGAWLVRDRASGLPAVDRNSPAALAGLKEGDVIQRVDRDILDGSADLGEVLAQYKTGSEVTLTVLRNGETLDVPVTLGDEIVSRELK